MFRDESNVRSAPGASRLDQVRFPHTAERGEVEEKSTASKARSGAGSIIGRFPVAALGVALFAGIALGWWVKRR